MIIIMIEKSSQNSIIMFKSNFEYKQHAGPTKVSALGSNCSLVLKPEKKYCSIFIKKNVILFVARGLREISRNRDLSSS